MLISVCIPVKNSEWCLPYCLDSLKKQTVQPDEYLFCVSSSQDNTMKLIIEFKNKIEFIHKIKVKIIHDNNNLGTGYARKVLTNKAEGKYISWVDADHILPKNWIEALLYLENKYEFDGLEGEIEELTLKETDELGNEGKLNFAVDVANSPLVDTEWKGRYGMGRHLLKRECIIRVGNFDSFFTRGQTADLTYRFNVNNIKRLRCKDLKFYHIGLLEGYKKKGIIGNILRRCTYLKFFYKYGLKALTMEAIFTLSFIGRLALIGLFILDVIFYKQIVFLFLTLIALLMLFTVTISRYGFKPNILLIQLGKCIGELVVVYDIIKYKNRQPFGYGKKYLKQEKTK